MADPAEERHLLKTMSRHQLVYRLGLKKTILGRQARTHLEVEPVILDGLLRNGFPHALHIYRGPFTRGLLRLLAGLLRRLGLVDLDSVLLGTVAEEIVQQMGHRLGQLFLWYGEEERAQNVLSTAGKELHQGQGIHV